jgi:hypothetical protein
MIFIFAFVILSLIAFFLSIVFVLLIWEKRGTRKRSFVQLKKIIVKKNTRIVNSNPVLKKLEPQIERNYQRKLNL